jgi:hypothetical protein
LETQRPITADIVSIAKQFTALDGIDHLYSKEPGNAAEATAKTIFETRGNAPHLFSNTLVFLVSSHAGNYWK